MHMVHRHIHRQNTYRHESSTSLFKEKEEFQEENPRAGWRDAVVEIVTITGYSPPGTNATVDVSSAVGRSEKWQDGGRKWLNLVSLAPDKLSKSPWESPVERRGLQQREGSKQRKHSQELLMCRRTRHDPSTNPWGTLISVQQLSAE